MTEKNYYFQPAEKQLAATTTELASKRAIRLLPIFGVLLAIVLALVMIAIFIVFVVRGRRNHVAGNGSGSARRSSEMTTTTDSVHGSLTRMGAGATAVAVEEEEMMKLVQQQQQHQATAAATRTARSPDVVPVGDQG